MTTIRGFSADDFWKNHFDTDAELDISGAGFEPVPEKSPPNLVHKLFQRSFEGNVRKDFKEKVKFNSPILKDVNLNVVFNPSILKDIKREGDIPFAINKELIINIPFKINQTLPKSIDAEFEEIVEAYKVLKSKKYYDVYDD